MTVRAPHPNRPVRRPKHQPRCSMDFIWSPWRYDYLASGGKRPSSCVFCVTEDRSHDEERLVLFRGNHNFIILNLFPYTSGHLMIAPYEHLDAITAAEADQLLEMMQ